LLDDGACYRERQLLILFMKKPAPKGSAKGYKDKDDKGKKGGKK
jgi:hypothetical protein